VTWLLLALGAPFCRATGTIVGTITQRSNLQLQRRCGRTSPWTRGEADDHQSSNDRENCTDDIGYASASDLQLPTATGATPRCRSRRMRRTPFQQNAESVRVRAKAKPMRLATPRTRTTGAASRRAHIQNAKQPAISMNAATAKTARLALTSRAKRRQTLACQTDR
jgi:hypothetical protein